MKLVSHSFENNGAIPGRCAFAVKTPKGHTRFSDNLNPHLAWRAAPKATQSYALLCTDADAPTKGDDVNQEGRTVAADLPRAEFVHWVLANIPAGVTSLAEGSCSNGVTAKGKTSPKGPAGSVQGINDYTGWLKGDKTMAGTYHGYDGPCPPWNDARIHRYTFEVFALDVASLPVKNGCTIADVRKALDGHVLGKASITARYSLNPNVQINSVLLRQVRKPSRVFGRKIGNKQGCV